MTEQGERCGCPPRVLTGRCNEEPQAAVGLNRFFQIAHGDQRVVDTKKCHGTLLCEAAKAAGFAVSDGGFGTIDSFASGN